MTREYLVLDFISDWVWRRNAYGWVYEEFFKKHGFEYKDHGFGIYGFWYRGVYFGSVYHGAVTLFDAIGIFNDKLEPTNNYTTRYSLVSIWDNPNPLENHIMCLLNDYKHREIELKKEKINRDFYGN